MANQSKTSHPFVSYLLMGTFIIQVLLVGFGIYPANSAETFVCLFFFLEGAYLYKREGYIGQNSITYAKGMFQQVHIPYAAISKVELSTKKRSSEANSSRKEKVPTFIITSKDGGEHMVPITPRLIEQLKDHKIKVPNLKDIKYFKLTYPSADRFMMFEVILLLVIWVSKFKMLGLIDAQSQGTYSALETVFGIICAVLLLVFVHMTTVRLTYTSGHMKVRGLTVRQDVNIKSITKAEVKRKGIFTFYIVRVGQKKVLATGYMSGMGLLYAMCNAYGATLVSNKPQGEEVSKVTEISEE